MKETAGPLSRAALLGRLKAARRRTFSGQSCAKALRAMGGTDDSKGAVPAGDAAPATAVDVPTELAAADIEQLKALCASGVSAQLLRDDAALKATPLGPKALRTTMCGLGLPWGNPILLFFALAVIALGFFGIASGFQKARLNLRMPATRSGTINIPRNAIAVKTFPAFGVIVCPLDPDTDLQLRGVPTADLASTLAQLKTASQAAGPATSTTTTTTDHLHGDSSSSATSSTSTSESDDSTGGSEPMSDSDFLSDSSGGIEAFDASKYNASRPSARPKPINTTKLREQGLLQPLSKGGILPLFGLFNANQLSSCYEVPVAQTGFSPQLKHVFVDPFSNSTLNLASFNLLVTTESDIVVALYPLRQDLRDVSNFIIIKSKKTDPRNSGVLTRDLKPWVNSAVQVQSMLSGAKNKKQANEVYDSSWDLVVQNSDGVENAVQRQPSVRLASGSSAFVINFQAYFVDFDATFSEGFYAYDLSDAISNMFVYLTTISTGLAVVKGLPLVLGSSLSGMGTILGALAKGDEKAAYGAAATAHQAEVDQGAPKPAESA